jgi:hypothetical protein
MSATFQLPKLYCPISSTPHPQMEEIERETMERWSQMLGLHAKHRAFKKLQRSRFPVLVASCHPGASMERMSAALDFLIWNFLWDDQLDVGDVTPEWVRQQNEQAVAVLRGEMPDNEAPPLLWLLQDIRDRMSALMPATWMERFIRACQAYFDGTVWEAETRTKRITHDVETYIQLRRLSVGCFMVFVQVEAIENVLLSPEVLAHPAIEQLVATATDAIGWANDLFSLAQDLNDEFHPNLVISVQKQDGMELQAAVDRSVKMHDDAVSRFLEMEANLPDFGELNEQVAVFVAGVRRWIRANVDWSILTGRYQESDAAFLAGVDRELAA